MDIDSALKVADGEDIRNRCHVNSNEDGDRFVGVKADSDKAMVYFPIGYQLPETDQEIRTDIKHLIQVSLSIVVCISKLTSYDLYRCFYIGTGSRFFWHIRNI